MLVKISNTYLQNKSLEIILILSSDLLWYSIENTLRMFSPH